MFGVDVRFALRHSNQRAYALIRRSREVIIKTTFQHSKAHLADLRGRTSPIRCSVQVTVPSWVLRDRAKSVSIQPAAELDFPQRRGGELEFRLWDFDANSPWEPNQNPQNVVQALLSATSNQIGGTYNFTYYATGELGTVTLPFGGRMRWTYGEWTSSSQRIVREVNQRWLMTSPGATETAHYLSWDASDANFEYHQVRIVSDQTNAYDKIWWFNSSRQLQTFDERKQPGSNIRVRKYFTWAVTPTSQQPYITQVDTTLEASSASPVQKRSTQILDAYGNVTESREYDYGVVNYRKYTMQYLTDANYTTRFIRNRLTSLSLSLNGGAATNLLTKGYDHAAFGSCGYQGGYGNYPLLPNVTLHDDANYGLSFSFRGNVTGSTSSGTTVCQLVDYLGAVRSATGPFGTTTTTPDATKQYAVPSLITAKGYSTSMQWDSLLNLTQSTGPNNATMSFGYDVASWPASTQGVDGDAVTYTYSTPSRYSMATTGKKFVKTSVDGLGRTVKVEMLGAIGKLNVEYGPGSLDIHANLYKDASPQVYSAAQAQYGSTTISQLFAKGGTTAVSSLGGNNIYIDPISVIQYGSAYQGGLIIHELLHNIGKTDSDLSISLFGVDFSGRDTRTVSMKMMDCLN